MDPNTQSAQTEVPPVSLPPTPQTPPATSGTQGQSGTSNGAKTIITILLLIFIYPLGIVLMWVWTKWPIWIKILLTLFLALFLLILAILFPIILVAVINPPQQFSKARNVQRFSDVNMILNSINIYKVDNDDSLPKGITSTPKSISSQEINICSDLVPTYIRYLPRDPSINNGANITDCSSDYNTGYVVSADNQGTVTVAAPKAESDAPISVRR